MKFELKKKRNNIHNSFISELNMFVILSQKCTVLWQNGHNKCNILTILLIINFYSL